MSTDFLPRYFIAKRFCDGRADCLGFGVTNLSSAFLAESAANMARLFQGNYDYRYIVVDDQGQEVKDHA